jgi:serine protease Do
MNKRRLLYTTLIVATLTIGVVIGSIVSGGARAGEQKPAPLIIPDPVSLSNAFSQIAAQLGPAVVNITTESMIEAPTRSRGRGGRGGNGQTPNDPFGFFDFFGGNPDVPEKASGVGSGVIVDKAGYILTNQHVIDKATKITVRLEDKSEFPGKVVGSDNETDLAVVKIDVGRELAAAKMGNSDPVRVGDWVLAIGSPFNQDHTVTAGIVSAKGRENIGGAPNNFQSFIQTDAAINPGNSGGPLVNMAGEVIGINTAILSETRSFAGLGFALPSNTAIKVYNQLVQNGKVTRGGIGVSYVDDPQLLKALGLKNGDGVVVQDVPAGKPAAKAGVRPGDVILSIDGQKTPSGSVLLDIIANEPIGKTVQVKVNRDGKEMSFPVTVTDRANVVTDESLGAIKPRGGDAQGAEASLGLHVAPVTPDQARRLGISADGVLVTSVDRGSVAEESGIGTDFVILRVIAGSQRIDVHNMDDFRNAEKLLKPGASVAIQVLRPDPRSNGFSTAIIPIQIP